MSDQLLAPSAWVTRFARLLPARARVLDVAAGSGRHVRFLMARGHHVTAIDRDAAALQLTGASHLICADLEQGAPPLAQYRFDGVIATNYLHRALLPQIGAWVGEGGVLIYETFMIGQAEFGKPSNADFLLKPNELLGAFAQLQVVAFEQGIDADAKPRVVQRLCAVRRSKVQPLSALSGFTGPGRGASLSDGQIR